MNFALRFLLIPLSGSLATQLATGCLKRARCCLLVSVCRNCLAFWGGTIHTHKKGDRDPHWLGQWVPSDRVVSHVLLYRTRGATRAFFNAEGVVLHRPGPTKTSLASLRAALGGSAVIRRYAEGVTQARRSTSTRHCVTPTA